MAPKSKIIKSDQVDKDVSLDARLNMSDSDDSVLSSDEKVISQDDLNALSKAKKILEEAKAKAKIIKAGAKEIYLQVEDKMEEAKKEGFEKGRQEGLATVTEQLVLIQRQNKEMLAKIEKEAISLVYEISQKIIGDSIQTSDEALLGMIRHALQSSMGNELTLFVNPSDYERIRDQDAQIMTALQAVQTVHIKPSENVKVGGCVIESELGTIDAQLDYQLEAIQKALDLSETSEEDPPSSRGARLRRGEGKNGGMKDLE